jgi:nitrate reductase alpha subunit
MIGGYAQLAYSFNYYGTVGSNRDEFKSGPRNQSNLKKYLLRL